MTDMKEKKNGDSPMERIRTAVVQVGSCVFETTRTLEKVGASCEKAAKQGAKLVVFPEALVGGYPKGAHFGARVGSRSAEGREDFRRYYAAAISVPSDETLILGELALKHDINIVIGVVEKDSATLYCSVLFFGADGKLRGKHRKIMPTAMERLIWGFGDGSTMPAIRTEFGILGAAICWENYMPLFRAAMYAKGVTIWCAQTVDNRELWQATMKHIALEGRCFVLSACQYLAGADSAPKYEAIPEGSSEAVLIKGGSVIISPFGEILAGPLYGGEDILFADLDLKEVIRGKFDLDVAGHYSRPDIFSLSVDQRPKRPVEFLE